MQAAQPVRADFRHLIEQTIRWGDMDALGHVNNVQFFRYFESGRIDYMDHLIASRNSSDNTVLADIQCSFLRQLSYPATVTVATRVARIGRSSLHLSCALLPTDTASTTLYATAQAVIVWFDFTQQRSVALPSAVREAIIAFEPITPEHA